MACALQHEGALGNNLRSNVLSVRGLARVGRLVAGTEKRYGTTTLGEREREYRGWVRTMITGRVPRLGSKVRRRSRSVHGVVAAVAALLCAGGLLSSCGGSSHASGVQGPSEVRAEPVSMTTSNPFTAPVGSDKSGVMPPAAAVNPQGGPPTYTGSLPGLYGGTRNYKTCDAGELVTFLEQNQAKAVAWARALGIEVSEIRKYVSSLTPVLLRTDTRVTNHGYVNGEADPIQSVLEAGTAVFVDKYGEPAVKCYCGNPLTSPQVYTAPRYYGATWTGFAPASITIINRSTTIIDTFQLYDPNTGKLFPRKAGPWNPGSDGPYSGGSPTAQTPNTTTTNTPAGSQSPSGRPAASFSPSSGQVGDTYVLSVSGFAPGATLDLRVLLPNGQSDGVSRSISIGSDGRGTYTFYNGGAGSRGGPGTYTAVVEDTQTRATAQAVVDVSPAGSPSSTTTTSTETTTTSTSPPTPEGDAEP